jgi:uncharacterized protein YggE
LMAAGFAKAKARTLAEQFGARVIAVHHLAEDSSYTQPRTYSSYGLESAALASGEPASTGTPIEPGLVQVRATVLLTVEIDHNVD